jgi:transglutaminase-like putative cysteine protease
VASSPNGPSRRLSYEKKLASFALVAAITSAAVGCESGDPGDGTRPNEVAPAGESPTILPGTASGFLDPLTSEQAVRDLFEVESRNAEYWRLLTLDRYDGEAWTSSDPEGLRGKTLPTPATLPTPWSHPADAQPMNQTFRILSDLDIAHALPIAQTAEEIAGSIGDITWDPVRAQAFIDGGLKEGMVYTVRSRIVIPTPEELDRVESLAPQAYGVWTELPGDLDPRIGQIAERWTSGATSDYRKVLAIQQHFHRPGFVYSTDVDTPIDADGLLEFLTRTRTGFCQHYTAAMTVMVRALGLPARIAVGYRSGTKQEDGSYLVQSDDAHVWVEVLFQGYGWLPFEPEQGTTHPKAQAGTYLNP